MNRNSWKRIHGTQNSTHPNTTRTKIHEREIHDSKKFANPNLTREANEQNATQHFNETETGIETENWKRKIENVRQVPDEALERARNLRQISRTVNAAQRKEADEYIARQVSRAPLPCRAGVYI